MLRSPLAVPKAYWLRKADDSTDGDSTCWMGSRSSITTWWVSNAITWLAQTSYRPGSTPSLFTSSMTAVGSAKVDSRRSWLTEKQAAQEKFARTIPFRISADETLDIGEDTGTPVSEDYHVPFKFTGTIGKVVILLGDEKITAADQKAIEQAAADLSTDE